jgi:predicted GNAT superfamily acetyltransferase
MNDGITIRPLTDYDEFLACETLQKLAWKMTDDRDVVPAHMLKPIAEHGGIILGAFNEKFDIIGFVFGFVGKTEDDRAAWMGTPYILCSEMMGVLPEYRSRAVGYRLKLAQRDFALAQGYKLMIWTYDPLLSLNANLNIGKLGCICRHYVEDAYGQLGGIYAGLSTDRFEVEWWIASQRVKNRMGNAVPAESAESWRAQGIETANSATLGGDGLLRPGKFDFGSPAAQILVEFPADFQAIKQADAALAQTWRAHTRALFEEAFDRGYVVTALARGPSDRRLSSFYLLTNQLDIPSMARGTA